MTNSENYNSALARIEKATTAKELAKLDKSLDRLYNAACLTEKEFSKLTVKIMEKMCK